MALLLNNIIQLNSSNTSITMFDTTGDYSSLNLGGWGTPNPETTDVTEASLTISIQGYNSYAPVEVDITASFVDLFTVGGLNLTAQDALGVPTLPDGWYSFTYSVVALGIEYSYTSEQAFFGEVQCCVKQATSQLEIPESDIKKSEQIYYINLLFDGLTSSACCGNQTRYLKILKELKRICGGCGDSTYVNSTGSNTGYQTGGCGGCK